MCDGSKSDEEREKEIKYFEDKIKKMQTTYDHVFNIKNLSMTQSISFVHDSCDEVERNYVREMELVREQLFIARNQ
jgi:hypothetical protein